MDKYFARISSLSTNKELPMRIRFMLLDVIDLRSNSVSVKTFNMCMSCILCVQALFSPLLESLGNTIVIELTRLLLL